MIEAVCSAGAFEALGGVLSVILVASVGVRWSFWGNWLFDFNFLSSCTQNTQIRSTLPNTMLSNSETCTKSSTLPDNPQISMTSRRSQRIEWNIPKMHFPELSLLLPALHKNVEGKWSEMNSDKKFLMVFSSENGNCKIILHARSNRLLWFSWWEDLIRCRKFNLSFAAKKSSTSIFALTPTRVVRRIRFAI